MKKISATKKLASAFLAFSMFIVPFSIGAQTRMKAPKNKYQPKDDVKLGSEAAAEAEKQLPILRDSQITNYVQEVGDKLVDAIPSEFQHSEFRYTFKVVDASDINAFALPGGPMYVNRGMIQAAKNEGEMAGVMAHELSHVALRHGTAQATKQSSIGNQILGIGAILGGAILAGETGAQLGALGVQAYFTKFSREYETQADVLGAQIMARAGYDPRDLANMFRTIQAQGSSRAPEFLSSHPNPSNRYNRINQEAALLRVSAKPIKTTTEFQNVQARLNRLPKGQTTAQIERGSGNSNAGAGGRYTRRVELPSSRVRSYDADFLRIDVPDNWQQYAEGNSVIFAPDGAIGNNGITHGMMIGVAQSNSRDLRTATQNHLSDLLKAEGNNYLRQQGGYLRTSIDGRNAFQTVLRGTSPITGQAETVTIYTTQLRDGSLFYVATVAPQAEASSYNRTFNALINSLQLND